MLNTGKTGVAANGRPLPEVAGEWKVENWCFFEWIVIHAKGPERACCRAGCRCRVKNFRQGTRKQVSCNPQDPARSSAAAAAIEMTQQGHKIAFSMETFHPAPYNEETTSVVTSKDGYIACEYDSIVGRHRDWAGDNNNTVCVTHIRLVEHGPLVMLTARWSCSQPVIDREPDRITEASPA